MLPARRARHAPAALPRGVARRDGDGSLRRAGAGNGRSGATPILDIEPHAVEHEQEDFLDCRARLCGRQHHLPADMAGGRLQLVQRRHGGGVGDHRAGAERAQLVEQQQWVGTHRHRVDGQPEAQTASVQAAGSGGAASAAPGRAKSGTGASAATTPCNSSRMRAPAASLASPAARSGGGSGPWRPTPPRSAGGWPGPAPCAPDRRRSRHDG